MQCTTVQPSTVQYNTLRKNTVQNSRIQYGRTTYSALEYNTAGKTICTWPPGERKHTTHNSGINTALCYFVLHCTSSTAL